MHISHAFLVQGVEGLSKIDMSGSSMNACANPGTGECQGNTYPRSLIMLNPFQRRIAGLCTAQQGAKDNYNAIQ